MAVAPLRVAEAAGLLCHRCNMAMGLLRDNIDALTRAADYIRRQGVMSDVVG